MSTTGTDSIFDPWPTKDVRGLLKHDPTPLNSRLTNQLFLDCLHVYRGDCHAGSAPGVVLVGSRIHVLPHQSISES